jgi:hypothetical protein
VPDYQITIAGRMGPVVASCLPGLRPITPSATVLHLLVSNRTVLLQLLKMLADHHLTPIDVRIEPEPTSPCAPASARLGSPPSQPNPLTE